MSTNPVDHEKLILDVCDGNPGALRLAIDLIRAGHLTTVQKMRRLGITGPLVWLAYKDLGNGTPSQLVANVESADIGGRLTALGYAPKETTQP